MSKLTENVAIVAGTGVTRGVGMPALYGGAEVLEGNERYASMLNAQEYGNHLPQFWRYCRELAAQVGELNPSHVHQGLAERGYTDVEEVTTATEDLIFSLPRELRPSRTAGRKA